MKKIVILGLVGVFLGLSGCALSDKFWKNHNIPPNTTSTTSVSTIDINNPETWTTFDFKELGFSMKLPFGMNGSGYVGHYLCEKEAGAGFFDQEGCENNKGYNYVYSDSLDFEKSGTTYDFLGSVSDNFVIRQNTLRWGFPWLRNFVSKNNTYVAGETIIHPLKVIDRAGVSVIVYDAQKDVGFGQRAYGALFNLPKNNAKNFKATAIEFAEADLSYEQFITAINTISF